MAKEEKMVGVVWSSASGQNERTQKTPARLAVTFPSNVLKEKQSGCS